MHTTEEEREQSQNRVKHTPGQQYLQLETIMELGWKEGNPYIYHTISWDFTFLGLLVL